MKQILTLFFLILCLLFQSSSATPQLPNSLFYEGKEYPINDDPMYDYFEKYPQRRPKLEGQMSSLWRGYLAHFEFLGSELFLKDLKIYGLMDTPSEYATLGWKSVLKENIGGEKKLKIEWFAGLLVSGYGDNRHDPHDFFEHQKHYSNYAVFEVDAGTLKNHRFFENKDFLVFLKRQFEEFKKTPEFTKLVQELSENGRKRQDSESIIEESILSYTKRILVK